MISTATHDGGAQDEGVSSWSLVPDDIRTGVLAIAAAGRTTGHPPARPDATAGDGGEAPARTIAA